MSLWGSGYLLCLSCDEEHLGVWEIGSEPVGCPECGAVACVPYDGIGFGDAQAIAQAIDQEYKA